jgi:hypothetical protein
MRLTMSGIYGPNMSKYIQALQASLVASQEETVRQDQRTQRVNQAYKYGKKAYDAYQMYNAANAAKSTYDIAMGTAQGIDAIAPAASTASNVITTAAPVAETVGTVAPVVGPTIEAASKLAPATNTVSTTGTTIGGAATTTSYNTGIVGAAIAAGLAISSAKPGGWLFGTKKFLYNGNKYAQSPMSPLSLGPPGLFQHAERSWNNVFGDPNKQEQDMKDQQSSRARLFALRSLNGRNASNVVDEATGREVEY